MQGLEAMSASFVHSNMYVPFLRMLRLQQEVGSGELDNARIRRYGRSQQSPDCDGRVTYCDFIGQAFLFPCLVLGVATF